MVAGLLVKTFYKCITFFATCERRFHALSDFLLSSFFICFSYCINMMVTNPKWLNYNVLMISYA